jgi:hypothetical protein
MKESDIQRKIIEFLTKSGYYAVKIIQTNKNGWPDIQAHKDGKTIFIEVKSEKGVVSDLQKYRHKELEKNGFNIIITTSQKHLENELNRISKELFKT